MAFIQATFSLPGLAGLALTIGMAVDANVLVFERMREEKERGASLAQQIRNGFNRAWVTIFDSHVTNFLAAIVLYVVGTEEVKGFALTMIIGMAWNLFTAVFMSRVIFEYCYAKGWLKKVTMLKMMDKTNIDFIGPRYYCMAGSLILISWAWSPSFVRGRTMFNIDFTGGTLVTIRLNETDPTVQPLSESKRAEFVREKAERLARRDRREPAGRQRQEAWRGSTSARRNDQDSGSKVKNKILEAVRAEPGPGRDDRTATASRSPPRRPAGDAAKTAPAPTTRFAGGREYRSDFNTTAFNSTQAPAQVVAADVRQGAREVPSIANPTIPVRDRRQHRRHGESGHGSAGPSSSCAPTSSPMSPRPSSASSRSRWPTTATCCSSESPTSAAPSPARPAPSP